MLLYFGYFHNPCFSWLKVCRPENRQNTKYLSRYACNTSDIVSCGQIEMEIDDDRRNKTTLENVLSGSTCKRIFQTYNVFRY